MSTPKTARIVLWFVRGTYQDGTRWESGHKHATRDEAESEMQIWAKSAKSSKTITVARQVTITPKTEMTPKDEIDQLKHEIAQLRQAIANFCEGQESACLEWKQQPHIAPLFEIDSITPPITNNTKCKKSKNQS